MGAENRSGKREFQLRAGAGFCVFKGSGCENRKGKVARHGILISTRLHELTSADRIVCNDVCRLSSNELTKEE